MRAWLLLMLALVGCGGRAGSPGSAVRAGGYLIYVHDREGSLLAAVDERGQLLSSSVDDGFGLRLSSTGTPVPRDFLDQELDEETGYLHFQARYYDPTTAQWISPDPKLLGTLDCSARGQECNPYAYGGNRPGEWVDADGREVVRFTDRNGVQNVIFTVAFYGPAAEADRALLLDRVSTLTGPVKVTALSVVVPDAARVPAGMTAIHATEESAPPSMTEKIGGLEIFARADATNAKYGGTVLLHELNHTAGLPDSYQGEGLLQRLQLAATGQSQQQHPGELQGNFYLGTPPSGYTTSEARQLSAVSPAALNVGATLNDPSFIDDPTLRTASGGGISSPPPSPPAN